MVYTMIHTSYNNYLLIILDKRTWYFDIHTSYNNLQ
jgi:hypothetical protein